MNQNIENKTIIGLNIFYISLIIIIFMIINIIMPLFNINIILKLKLKRY